MSFCPEIFYLFSSLPTLEICKRRSTHMEFYFLSSLLLSCYDEKQCKMNFYYGEREKESWAIKYSAYRWKIVIHMNLPCLAWHYYYIFPLLFLFVRHKRMGLFARGKICIHILTYLIAFVWWCLSSSSSLISCIFKTEHFRMLFAYLFVKWVVCVSPHTFFMKFTQARTGKRRTNVTCNFFTWKSHIAFHFANWVRLWTIE